MDQRGAAESGGAALACAVAAAATFQVVASTVDWALVLGIGMCAGIAGAANYQARTKHSDHVADEAPVETTGADGEPSGQD
ncbi:hypothetical protein SAMN05216559_3920 [Halomicrobium zhouii]|uniref:Uncharacterized protein n=1 Tax=Halomicrobium zhouii TaxID=767519 RepID=A0A1I6M839_9EURY|nr:hypothetical protein [Halomicrobium zhouii]SFS11672.1 hypothetical protein SAMN05216559_3920 [Halomicrobium zhouii]